MYTFIDVSDVQTSNALPAEALQFNGQWLDQVIPGFRTLNVSGREMIETEITDLQIGTANGSKYRRKRYPSRFITVKYQLIADSPSDFRAAYNQLNQLLSAEEARLIFNDEPGMDFVGTKSGGSSPEPGSNNVTGEIEFYCSDPFKYSVEEHEVSPSIDDDLTFVIDYEGTHNAYPVIEATMDGDNGFVGFVDAQGNILQFGDVDEVDEEAYERSETLIYDEMVTGVSGWTLNQATTVKVSSEHKQDGTVVINENNIRSALKAQDYGSGAQWHGPSWTKSVPGDSKGHVGAKNCTLSWHHYFAASSAEMGVIQFLMTDANKKNVAAVTYFKNGSGTNRAKIHCYVNGIMRRELEFNCESWNDVTGQGSGRSSISKFGSEFEFNIAGQIYSFTFPEMEEVEVTEISTFIGKWGNNASLDSNQVYSMKFVKHSVQAWRNVPNKFGDGDVLTIDCASGDVMLNGVKTAGLGVLGNQWEEFSLVPGTNQIRCTYSGWAMKPVFRLKYREVCM